MAVVYRKQGKYEEALTMYEKTLSIQLKKLEMIILMLLPRKIAFRQFWKNYILMLLLRTITWLGYTRIKAI